MVCFSSGGAGALVEPEIKVFVLTYGFVSICLEGTDCENRPRIQSTPIQSPVQAGTIKRILHLKKRSLTTDGKRWTRIQSRCAHREDSPTGECESHLPIRVYPCESVVHNFLASSIQRNSGSSFRCSSGRLQSARHRSQHDGNVTHRLSPPD